MFKAKNIHLRSVEPSDATTLMLWENNPNHWKVTDTEVPFSLHAIMQLIDQQQQIRKTGQLRLMICLNNEDQTSVGAIDLYDVDFKNRNAAVGILIGEDAHKEKGYAKESLLLLTQYAKDHLNLYNLYCSIQSDNITSIKLFESCGFQKVGERKNWFHTKDKRLNELIFQLCLEK